MQVLAKVAKVQPILRLGPSQPRWSLTHLVIHAAAVEVVEGGPLQLSDKQVGIVGLRRRNLPPLPPEPSRPPAAAAASAAVGEAEPERRLRLRRRRRGRCFRRDRRKCGQEVKDEDGFSRDSAASADAVLLLRGAAGYFILFGRLLRRQSRRRLATLQ